MDSDKVTHVFETPCSLLVKLDVHHRRQHP